MTEPNQKAPWRRWSYAVAVLTAAAMIAAPALVSAQSFSHGEDQMFTSLPLCQIIDSRNWDASQFGGDTKPQPDTTYTFDIRGASQSFEDQGGSSSGCGVPSSADAVVINILAVGPDGGGNMKAFPEDQAHTDVSGTVINYQSYDPNVNLNNAVTVLMDASTDDGDINIRPQINATHIIGTVMGYYENVTDGFFTETQSDARYARDFHDHEITQVIEESASVPASTDNSQIASMTVSLADECLLTGDQHNLLVTATGTVRESDDVSVDLELNVDGDVREATTQTLGGDDTVRNDDSFTVRELITQIDSDGDGTDDQFIDSGDHTIEFQVDNNDTDDPTTIANVVLTAERMGWGCEPLTLDESSDDDGRAPAGDSTSSDTNDPSNDPDPDDPDINS